MIITRVIAGLIIALASCALAAPGWAVVEGMRFNESFAPSVIRPAQAPTILPITIDETAPGRVRAEMTNLSDGFRAVKLPPEVRDALAFLIRWGAGRMTTAEHPGLDPAMPITLGNVESATLGEATLLLPLSGLRVDRTAIPATVSVGAAHVRAGGKDYTGGLTLTMTPTGSGRFRVTAVAVR